VITGRPSRPAVDPELVERFHLPGARQPPCLLIHGFSGTPYETRALGEALQARGHAALGVRLAGHGRSIEELERSTWQDWYRDVAAACTELVADGGPVAVIGVSAGSLLALHLAHERPDDVHGLVLMANAIRLNWPARWAVPLLARIPRLRERFRYLPKVVGSDIADPEARRVHPSHRVVPLAGVASLTELQRRVRSECRAVKHPTLVIHGARDRTCPSTNAELLASLLGTRPQRVVILPKSAHIVTVDVEREQVVAEVTRFLADLPSSRAR
jgi:carboxylesterase